MRISRSKITLEVLTLGKLLGMLQKFKTLANMENMENLLNGILGVKVYFLLSWVYRTNYSDL
jgi:hypothetical protein